MRLRRHAGRVTLAELILICVILFVIGALAIPNWAVSRQKAAEARAQTALKSIVTAQGVWRQGDFDRNGSQDYWTPDIAGLYGVQQSAGKPRAAIDADTAAMDAAPAATYPGLQSHDDSGGYALIAMTTDENKSPYVEPGQASMTAAPLAGRVATNTSKYGFCAYPTGSIGNAATQFIVNEEGVVYRVEGLAAPVVPFSSVFPPTPLPLSGHGPE